MAIIALKSIIISLIATCSMNLIYSINNSTILIGINILTILGCCIILKKDAEDKEEKLKNGKEDIIKEIKDSINNLNNNLDNNIKILSNDIQSNIVSLEELLLKFDEKNLIKIEQLVEIMKKNNNLTIDSINEIRTSNDDNLHKYIENIKKISNLNIEAYMEYKDEMVDEIESNRNEIINMCRELKRARKDIVTNLEESIVSDNQIVQQYKEIQGAMLSELDELANKNLHITELLKSNYKVLNTLFD